MAAPSIPLINPLLRVGPTTLEFWWDPPASGPVTSYTLSCASPAITETYGPTTYYALIAGLTTGQEYAFTLTATNGFGTSPAAEFIASTPGFLPSPPLSTIATAYQLSNILVSWSAPLDNGQAPIKYYAVDSYYTSSAITLSTSYGLPFSQSNIFIVGGLSTIVTQVQVYAINDPGYSSPANKFISQFSPLSISTCETWLDASDVANFSLTGSTIITWADKSGFSRTAAQYNSPNGSTFYQTLNGYPGVQFRGSNINYSPTMSNEVPVNTFSNGIAMFVVFSSLDPGSTYGVLTTRTSGFLAHPFDMYNEQRYLGGTNQQGFTSPADIRTYTSTALFEMTAGCNLVYNEWINGSTIIENYSTGANTYDDTAVGYLYYGSRQDNYTFFNGTINEVIVYSLSTNVDFPSTSREKVEGYLAWKWGFESSLPPGHPYSGAPPLS
jgi:hypothetical protein